MKFRSEGPADRQDIHELTVRAFADPDSGKEPGEAALLAEFYECEGCLPEYSVVAEHGGRVVGHAIATRGWLDGDIPLLGLGPISVDPVHQKQGGAGLLAEIRARATRDGERAVVLLGHIGYYICFGHAPEIPSGIVPSDPNRGDYFMVLNLSKKPLPPGNFRYAAPFVVWHPHPGEDVQGPRPPRVENESTRWPGPCCARCYAVSMCWRNLVASSCSVANSSVLSAVPIRA